MARAVLKSEACWLCGEVYPPEAGKAEAYICPACVQRLLVMPENIAYVLMNLFASGRPFDPGVLKADALGKPGSAVP